MRLVPIEVDVRLMWGGVPSTQLSPLETSLAVEMGLVVAPDAEARSADVIIVSPHMNISPTGRGLISSEAHLWLSVYTN